MERKSKEMLLDSGKEIVIPSSGGLLKYPTDAVLTVQVGKLSDVEGVFSKVKKGAGCTAIMIVLKKESE